MSNHLHVVVHIDPQAVHGWSAEEVARRWLGAFGSRSPDAPALEQRVRALAADEDRLEIVRARLGSLSWFMSALVQPIARRCNREDEVAGRFWEGRFHSQALLDERALLACMTYVDLNPQRAGVADTLEGSAHTSTRRRMESGVEQNQPLLPVAGNLDVPMPGLTERQYLELVRWSWAAREAKPPTLTALAGCRSASSRRPRPLDTSARRYAETLRAHDRRVGRAPSPRHSVPTAMTQGRQLRAIAGQAEALARLSHPEPAL